LIRLTRSAGTVCLGRNLITVFSTVNNPPPDFSTRRGAARAHANRNQPPWKRDANRGRTRIVATMKEKCLVFGTLRNSCVDARASTPVSTTGCLLSCSQVGGAVRRPKFFSRAGLFFASHKPNCARTHGRSGGCNRVLRRVVDSTDDVRCHPATASPPKKNRPPWATGLRARRGVRGGSVLVFFQQFGVVVRAEQFLKLVRFLGFEHEDPAVAIGVLVDGLRLVR